MGLSNGKTVPGNRKLLKENARHFNPNDPVPEVTGNDAKILKEMWATIQNDISKVGIITFVR